MENSSLLHRIRRNIFPIHTHELRKFVPLASIFFMISFNYSLMRALKDTYVLSYAGAEAISFLKLVGVTPGILVFTLIYTRISREVNRDLRFQLVMGYFLVFFAFIYFTMPYLKAVQLDSLANSLNASMPRLRGLWEAIRYWPASLLYINAEAWGTMALGVLFWTFVNEITGVEQSKRFYSFLSLGSSIGLIMSGALIKLLKRRITVLTGLIVIVIGFICIIYYRLSHGIRKNPELYQIEAKPKKKKARLSLSESVGFLMRSEYLSLIATLVVCYGVVINLFEQVWKMQVNIFTGGDKSMILDVYGTQSIASGVMAILLVVFLSTSIMRRGWRFAASVTPLITLVATIVFFAFMFFKESLGNVIAVWGAVPVELAVNIGLTNVVFVKASKYTLFDPTKERAYIPLDEESKVRGKAAVDGFGSRVGKSLGSAIVATLVFFLHSISNSMHVIFIIIVLTLLLWLRSVNRLGKLFKELTNEH